MSVPASYTIVPGLQDVGDSDKVKKGNPTEVAKRQAFKNTITEAAKVIGVVCVLPSPTPTIIRVTNG
jgi:hypothetical protein